MACIPQRFRTPAPGSHCWHPQPWMADELAPTDQPESTHHPATGRLVSQATPTPNFSPERELGESTHGYPLSPPEPPPASRRRFGGQDPLSNAQPRAPIHEPRAPSTNESHFSRPGFRSSTLRGPPPVPWLGRQGLASSMLSRPLPRSARPGDQRLFAETIRATCCPSASATECPASTPATTPIPTGPVASYHPTGRPPPLREMTGRASSGQGSLGSSSTSTPAMATARLGGFTPT